MLAILVRPPVSYSVPYKIRRIPVLEIVAESAFQGKTFQVSRRGVFSADNNSRAIRQAAFFNIRLVRIRVSRRGFLLRRLKRQPLGLTKGFFKPCVANEDSFDDCLRLVVPLCRVKQGKRHTQAEGHAGQRATMPIRGSVLKAGQEGVRKAR